MTVRRLVGLGLQGMCLEFGGRTPRIGHDAASVGNWRAQADLCRRGNAVWDGDDGGEEVKR